MTSALDFECDQLLAEMGYNFGAKFHIVEHGPDQDARWFYETTPSLRFAARNFLKGVDRHRPGFDAAMVRAIRRLKDRMAS